MRSALVLFAAGMVVVSGEHSADEKVISQFSERGPTDVKWSVVDDPVMGGRSVSKATVEKGMLHWAGEVKLVPFLHAPGFCTVRTDVFKSNFSAYEGGMFYSIQKNGGNLTNFKVQFSSSVRSGPKKGQFQCKLTLPAKPRAMAKYYVPFSSCKESWRGEPEGGAPTAAQLACITSIGLGSDGVAGDFDLTIRDVGVYKTAHHPGQNGRGMTACSSAYRGTSYGNVSSTCVPARTAVHDSESFCARAFNSANPDVRLCDPHSPAAFSVEAQNSSETIFRLFVSNPAIPLRHTASCQASLKRIACLTFQPTCDGSGRVPVPEVAGGGFTICQCLCDQAAAACNASSAQWNCQDQPNGSCTGADLCRQ